MVHTTIVHHKKAHATVLIGSLVISDTLPQETTLQSQRVISVTD